MDTLDYLRSAALLIAFLVTAFNGRKTWLLTDLIVTAVFGAAWYILPTYMLGFQTTVKVNHLHAYATRAFGGEMLASAFVWWKTRNSRDDTVPVTLMTGRVAGNSVLLLAMLYAQMVAPGKGQWAEQHIWFGMLGCACWLLGNLVQLIRTKDFGGSFQGNTRLDWHLRLDFFMFLLLAMLKFGFPDALPNSVKKLPLFKGGLDGIYLHMVRSFATQSFGYTLTVFNAPMFRYDDDKKAVLLGRLVTWLLLLLNVLWSYYNGLLTVHVVGAFLLFYGPQVINAVAGAFFYTRARPASMKKD